MENFDYNQILLEAVQNITDRYAKGEIQLLSESDLQSHLFSECAMLMKENNFPSPLQIFAERGVFEKRSKVDLVLGDNEILVELKFEPSWEAGGQGKVFTTMKEAGGPSGGSVEWDLIKIERYADWGKQAHFVMIDENGWHSKKILQEKWTQINAPTGKTVLLHVYKKANI